VNVVGDSIEKGVKTSMEYHKPYCVNLSNSDTIKFDIFFRDTDTDNSIDLLNKDDDKILHIKLKDNGKNDSIVVFNSLIKGSWGNEQRSTAKVSYGQLNNISIKDRSNEFSISINNKNYTYMKNNSQRVQKIISNYPESNITYQ